MQGIDDQHPADRMSPNLSANGIHWSRYTDQHHRLEEVTKGQCIQCRHKKQCSLHAKRRIGKRISPKAACLVHRMQKKKCPGVSCPASKIVTENCTAEFLFAGSQLSTIASHENRSQENTPVLPSSSPRASMPYNPVPFHTDCELVQDRRVFEELPTSLSAPDAIQSSLLASKLLRLPMFNDIVMDKLQKLEDQIKDMQTQRDRANKTSAALRIAVDVLRAENSYLKDLVLIMQTALDQDDALLQFPSNTVVPNEIHPESDTVVPSSMSTHNIMTTEEEIPVSPLRLSKPAPTLLPMKFPAPISKSTRFSIPGNIATTPSSDLHSIVFNKVPGSPGPLPEIQVMRGSVHEWFEPLTSDDQHHINIFSGPIVTDITPYDLEPDYSGQALFTDLHRSLGSPCWSFSPTPLVVAAKPRNGEPLVEEDHAVPDVFTK